MCPPPSTTSAVDRLRWRLLRHEFQLPFVYATLLVFLAGGAHVLGDGSPPWWLLIAFVWLFGIILWSSLCVVRHAEVLASRMGEPYGTLILTLSVIAIEVSTIITVMLHGADNPHWRRKPCWRSS